MLRDLSQRGERCEQSLAGGGTGAAGGWGCVVSTAAHLPTSTAVQGASPSPVALAHSPLCPLVSHQCQPEAPKTRRQAELMQSSNLIEISPQPQGRVFTRCFCLEEPLGSVRRCAGSLSAQPRGFSLGKALPHFFHCLQSWEGGSAQEPAAPSAGEGGRMGGLLAAGPVWWGGYRCGLVARGVWGGVALGCSCGVTRGVHGAASAQGTISGYPRGARRGITPGCSALSPGAREREEQPEGRLCGEGEMRVARSPPTPPPRSHMPCAALPPPPPSGGSARAAVRKQRVCSPEQE